MAAVADPASGSLLSHLLMSATRVADVEFEDADDAEEDIAPGVDFDRGVSTEIGGLADGAQVEAGMVVTTEEPISGGDFDDVQVTSSSPDGEVSHTPGPEKSSERE